MRDFTEIWQLQDTIITAVNACGYGVWDLHATSWGFHLELTEHLDDAEICNICSQLPLSGDYKGEGTNGSVLSLYNYRLLMFKNKIKHINCIARIIILNIRKKITAY